MKIRPVVAEFSHTESQTDTDKAKSLFAALLTRLNMQSNNLGYVVALSAHLHSMNQ